MSTLSELFARDPQSYSDQDLDEIIAYFRNSRKQFNAGNMKAGTTKKAPTEKQKASLAIANNLGELDL